MIRFTIKYSRT